MVKVTKSPKRSSSSAHAVGRAGFEKISAVEGITLTKDMQDDFKKFDREGLSASERRRELIRKYGPMR